ncbi:MAG TPA: hypothetical protein ENK18_19150, partial [Deltaproteobacteria bacterium]|nr:hypothetical protein [Deltaproteobacteria bacterium]
MDRSDLGDRMKGYEGREAGRRLMPRLPICVRIDGKRFSRFTKGLHRPYDTRLSELMVATTTHLVKQSNATIGYTQSDEISLILYQTGPRGEVMFDRRIQKLTSVLASMTTAYFNHHLADHIPEKAGQLALFDCRVWAVPDREEATNTLLWRELDATKNSISMAARAHYSHKQLMNRSGSEMLEMLFARGIDWNDFPAFFKRGTYVQRRRELRRFEAEELARLPPQHQAHSDPELMVERWIIQRLELPPLRRLSNRVAVVFDGAEPEAAEPGAAEPGAAEPGAAEPGAAEPG